MWSSSRRHAIALGAALLLATATARAQSPSPADVETAKAQYSQGLELRDKGDLPNALARFKAAFALVPTPITQLEVGRTQLSMGRVLEGRETLLAAAAMPHEQGESDRAQQARDEAAQLAEGARARIASVKVEYGAPPPATTPVLTIDGTEIPAAAANAPRMLDPGHHVVVARAAGKVGRAEVDLRDGEQRIVSLALTGDETAAPAGKGRLIPGPLAYIGFAVAGAGVLVGAGTGIAAIITANTVKGECPNGLCPPSAHGDHQTSIALGTTSTIAFAVGGAGLIAGIVGLLVSHREPERQHAVRLQPLVGPGTLGLSGSF